MDLVDLLPLVMFTSVAVLLFTGYPVAFVLGGVALFFGFIGAGFGVFKPIEFFNLLPRIWGGIAENLVLVAVPLFVFMGTMLERSDVAADLLRALQVLMRRVPGGLALAVTLMGTIMAATTGIVGASVVMLTMMALPVMLERRYSHELATGTIAAAGTLGILIPPSIMLVIMADLLSLSVGNLFFGAVFPGLLLSGLYLLFIALFATLRPASAPPMERDEGPADRSELVALLLKSFLPPTFLIVLVLGSIFAGWATPTEAAAVGAAGTVLLAALNRRLTLATLVEVCERTGLTCAMIFFIFIGATAFSYVFRSLGGDYVVEDLIAASGLESWGILLLIMFVVFILGFFFDWVEITLIVLPIFAPLLKALDFGDHVAKSELVYWFAILLAVNLQTSFLTPPFGFALFYMKGTCPPQVRLGEIYRGIVPFVILQLIGLALCIAFPEIVLWLPRMLLD